MKNLNSKEALIDLDVGNKENAAQSNKATKINNQTKLGNVRKKIKDAMLANGFTEKEVVATVAALTIVSAEPLHKIIVGGIVIGAEFLLIDALSQIPIQQVTEFVANNSLAIKRAVQAITVGVDFTLDFGTYVIIARSLLKFLAKKSGYSFKQKGKLGAQPQQNKGVEERSSDDLLSK